MSIFLQVVKCIVKIPALIGRIFCASLYLFFIFIEERVIRLLLHFDFVDPLLIQNYLQKEIKKLNETP